MSICIRIVNGCSDITVAMAELHKCNSYVYSTKLKTYSVVLHEKFVDPSLDASLYVFPLSTS